MALAPTARALLRQLETDCDNNDYDGGDGVDVPVGEYSPVDQEFTRSKTTDTAAPKAPRGLLSQSAASNSTSLYGVRDNSLASPTGGAGSGPMLPSEPYMPVHVPPPKRPAPAERPGARSSDVLLPWAAAASEVGDPIVRATPKPAVPPAAAAAAATDRDAIDEAAAHDSQLPGGLPWGLRAGASRSRPPGADGTAPSLGTVGPGRGLAAVLDAAEERIDDIAFAGLVLLSHAAADILPAVSPLHAAALARPQRRIGLRPMCNEPRCAITPMDAPTNPREAYLYYCAAFGVRPNSAMRSVLPESRRAFSRMATLSAAGNLVGDRGALPLLETARHCPNLTALELPSNGLTNAAAEWVAHFAAESPSLRRLDLSGNRLTLGAGLVLVEAVSFNPTIAECDVSGTRIPPQFMQRIAAIAGENATEAERAVEAVKAAAGK